MSELADELSVAADLLAENGMYSAEAVLRSEAKRCTVVDGSEPAWKQLGLDVRCRKAVLRCGASSLRDICRLSPFRLLECRNFGTGSLHRLMEALDKRGLQLRLLPSEMENASNELLGVVTYAWEKFGWDLPTTSIP